MVAVALLAVGVWCFTRFGTWSSEPRSGREGRQPSYLFGRCSSGRCRSRSFAARSGSRSRSSSPGAHDQLPAMALLERLAATTALFAVVAAGLRGVARFVWAERSPFTRRPARECPTPLPRPAKTAPHREGLASPYRERLDTYWRHNRRGYGRSHLTVNTETIQSEVDSLRARFSRAEFDSEPEPPCSDPLDRLRAVWRARRAVRRGRDARAEEISRAIRGPQSRQRPAGGGGGAARTTSARGGAAGPEINLRDSMHSAGPRKRSSPRARRPDLLGVMPTGREVADLPDPARLLGGTTLGLPLIALMKDQVDAMREAGIRATLELQPAPEEKRTPGGCGRARTNWCTPRRRESRPRGDRLWRGHPGADRRRRGPLHQPVRGHDFRPAYRQPGGTQAPFRRVPVLADCHRHPRGDARHRRAARDGATGPVRGSFFRETDISVYRKVPKAGRRDFGQRGKMVCARPYCGWSGRIRTERDNYCLSRKAARGPRRSSATASAPQIPTGYRPRIVPAHRMPFVAIRSTWSSRRWRSEWASTSRTSGTSFTVTCRDRSRATIREIGRAGRDGLPSTVRVFLFLGRSGKLHALCRRRTREVADRQQERPAKCSAWLTTRDLPATGGHRVPGQRGSPRARRRATSAASGCPGRYGPLPDMAPPAHHGGSVAHGGESPGGSQTDLLTDPRTEEVFARLRQLRRSCGRAGNSSSWCYSDAHPPGNGGRTNPDP